MNAILISVISLICLYIAYRFYGTYLSEKIFSLSNDNITPSVEFEDGFDFVPTTKYVLFGHHFASIAGLGPIVGPALAAIWGWFPCLFWIILGGIFFGAVHDLSALVVSLKHKGKSIGDLTEELIGPRAKILFLFITFFELAIAMGVFALITGILFGNSFYPESVIPVFALVVIAVIVGILVKLDKVNLKLASIIGFILLIIFIYIGGRCPITHIAGFEITTQVWTYVLLIYAFIASVLPVWLLLQPRDYLNSFQLYLGVALIFCGIFVYNPNISAPAIIMKPTNAPPLFPFLFITIACGAVSGFHSLVSSGTTARQLSKEMDAKLIGYGGMLVESLFAIGVLLACTASLNRQEWLAKYADWKSAESLGSSLSVFISGSAVFISSLGISTHFAKIFISVLAVGFAITSLDSGARLLRYNIEEISNTFNFKLGKNRYAASFLAVLSMGYFALIKIGGKTPGQILWQLFGICNQLLAGLALLVVLVYLKKKAKPILPIVIPAVIMLIITIIALFYKLDSFWIQKQFSLLIMGIILLILAVWLVIECILVLKPKKEVL